MSCELIGEELLTVTERMSDREWDRLFTHVRDQSCTVNIVYFNPETEAKHVFEYRKGSHGYARFAGWVKVGQQGGTMTQADVTPQQLHNTHEAPRMKLHA
jgi:hypothetical protein